MLRSELFDYNDVYVVVKGKIDLLAAAAAAAAANKDDKPGKDFAFKNNAPVRSCTSKINNIL